ncbi:MAG: ribosome silencing factor [Anaerolineales bacterium]
MQFAKKLVDVLEDKKATDILLLDVRALSPFTEYFVLCSGASHRTLQALVQAAREAGHQEYDLPSRVEGVPQDGWMLVDFGDVVLHVFSPDQRAYYQLEDLWREARVVLRLQ